MEGKTSEDGSPTVQLNRIPDRGRESDPEGRKSVEDKNGDIDDIFLLNIANRLSPKTCYQLGFFLGLTSPEIDGIVSSYPHDARKWVLQVLIAWKQRHSDDLGKTKFLADALEEMGRVDLAKMVAADVDNSQKFESVEETLTESTDEEYEEPGAGREIDSCTNQLENIKLTARICPECKVSTEAKTQKCNRIFKRSISYCEICIKSHNQNVKAITKCIDCEAFFCKLCLRSHKVLKHLAGHKCVDLSKSIVKLNLSSNPCDMHPKKTLRYCCKSCYQIVCRDCIVAEHKDHDFGELEQVFIQMTRQRERTLKRSVITNEKFRELLKKRTAEIKKEIARAREDQIAKANKQYEESVREDSLEDIDTILQTQLEKIEEYHTKNITDVDHLQSDNMRMIEACYDKLQSEILIARRALEHLSTKHSNHSESSIVALKELANKIQEWKVFHIADSRLPLAIPTYRYKYGGSNLEDPVFGEVSYVRNVVAENVTTQQKFKTTDMIYGLTVLENGIIVTAHRRGGIHIFDPIKKEIRTSIKMECCRFTSIANDIICVDYDHGAVVIFTDNGDTLRTLYCLKPPVTCVAAAAGGQLATIHGEKAEFKLSFVDITTDTIISTCDIEGDTKVPWMAINSRNEAIVAYPDDTIRSYNAQGELLYVFDPLIPNGHAFVVKGLCLDRFDNVIVSTDIPNSIHLLSPDGRSIRLLTSIKWPMDVTTDNDFNVFIGCWDGSIHLLKYLEEGKS